MRQPPFRSQARSLPPDRGKILTYSSNITISSLSGEVPDRAEGLLPHLHLYLLYMAELLEIYDLQSNLIGVQDRKEFYNEIREEAKADTPITRKVKTIKLLLMTSAGRIYVQKRSKLKEENTGMYDKTVGGHIVAGDSANMTVVKECAEEL